MLCTGQGSDMHISKDALFRRLTPEECGSFSTVQTRVLCFHKSHKDGPNLALKELGEGKLTKDNQSEPLCLTHSPKIESLPNNKIWALWHKFSSFLFKEKIK
jgi:hypothetical protein